MLSHLFVFSRLTQNETISQAFLQPIVHPEEATEVGAGDGAIQEEEDITHTVQGLMPQDQEEEHITG